MFSAKSPSRYVLPFLMLPLSEGLISLGSVPAEAMSRMDAIRLVVERNPAVEAARNAYEAPAPKHGRPAHYPIQSWNSSSKSCPTWAAWAIMKRARSRSANGLNFP